MSAEDRVKVASEIKAAVARAVKVVETTGGQLDPKVLLGLGAAAETDLAARPSHHDNEADHDHDDFDTFIVDIPQLDDPEVLVKRIRETADAHDILRIKGFADVKGKPMRLLIQGVGSRLQHQFDRPWRAGESRQGRLVVIGQKGLDRAAIAEAIGSM
jgi:cobalamin biosynthesis protein CobW